MESENSSLEVWRFRLWKPSSLGLHVKLGECSSILPIPAEFHPEKNRLKNSSCSKVYPSKGLHLKVKGPEGNESTKIKLIASKNTTETQPQRRSPNIVQTGSPNGDLRHAARRASENHVLQPTKKIPVGKIQNILSGNFWTILRWWVEKHSFRIASIVKHRMISLQVRRLTQKSKWFKLPPSFESKRVISGFRMLGKEPGFSWSNGHDLKIFRLHVLQYVLNGNLRVPQCQPSPRK